MKSSRKKGRVTGCITICLWIFALSVLLFFALSALAFYGFSLGVLGTTLALMSSGYREWLKNQRGFKSRLSKLPGMQSDSSVTLAIATAIYIFPLSAFSWVAMKSVFSDTPTAFIAAIIGSIGVVVVFGWLIIGWGIPKKVQDAPDVTKKTQEAQYFERIERLDQIKQLDPIAFERFVGTLFERMGYQVETTAITGDEGIDLVLRRDSKLAVAQCKRYEGSVGQPVVRDLYGVMVHNRADEAYLVTTGTITLPAQGWAKGKPIHLVDGNTLIKWLESFEGAPEEVEEIKEATSSDKLSFDKVVSSLRKNIIAIGALVVAVVLPICSCATGLLVFHQPSTTPAPTVTTTPIATPLQTAISVTPLPVEKLILTDPPLSTQSPPTALPTASPSSEPTLTAEAQLREDLVTVLGPPRDDDTPKLINFNLDEESRVIIVEWSIQGRPGSGVESDWAFEDAEKILITIGKGGIDFSTVEIIGVSDVTDSKGNTQTSEVIRLRFSRESLEDVNWEYFEPWHKMAPLHRWADYKEAQPLFQWWGDGD